MVQMTKNPIQKGGRASRHFVAARANEQQAKTTDDRDQRRAGENVDMESQVKHGL